MTSTTYSSNYLLSAHLGGSATGLSVRSRNRRYLSPCIHLTYGCQTRL